MMIRGRGRRHWFAIVELGREQCTGGHLELLSYGVGQVRPHDRAYKPQNADVQAPLLFEGSRSNFATWRLPSGHRRGIDRWTVFSGLPQSFDHDLRAGTIRFFGRNGDS